MANNLYDASYSVSSLTVTGFTTSLTSDYVGATFIGTDAGGNYFSRTVKSVASTSSFTIDAVLTSEGTCTSGYLIPLGSAGSRTDKIHDHIRLIVGRENIDKIPQQLIYNKIQDWQIRIAEEFLCIESSGTLSVTSGDESYSEPSGFYRMKLVSLPDGQSIIPYEVDYMEYDGMKRTLSTIEQNPMYFTRWDGVIYFYPTPSGSGTYTVYYYATPSTTVSTSVDPETPQRFDRLIEYGVILEFLPIINPSLMPIYQKFFDDERTRALRTQRSTHTVPLSITYHEF